MAGGSRKKIAALVATSSRAATANTPRQPIAGSAICTGTVVASAPSAPATSIHAVSCCWRPGAYQKRNARSEAISAAETPIPISAREIHSIDAERAPANSRHPPAATSSSVASTRREPKRSSSTPSGICTEAKARKYADDSEPSCAFVKPNSAISSGAMTAFTERRP